MRRIIWSLIAGSMLFHPSSAVSQVRQVDARLGVGEVIDWLPTTIETMIVATGHVILVIVQLGRTTSPRLAGSQSVQSSTARTKSCSVRSQVRIFGLSSRVRARFGVPAEDSV
jgi:hypothetical protein